jgi:hypothetical protein
MSEKMSKDIFTVLCNHQSRETAYGEHLDDKGLVESLDINWDNDRREWRLLSRWRFDDGSYGTWTSYVGWPSETWLAHYPREVLISMCRNLHC